MGRGLCCTPNGVLHPPPHDRERGRAPPASPVLLFLTSDPPSTHTAFVRAMARARARTTGTRVYQRVVRAGVPTVVLSARGIVHDVMTDLGMCEAEAPRVIVVGILVCMVMELASNPQRRLFAEASGTSMEDMRELLTSDIELHDASRAMRVCWRGPPFVSMLPQPLRAHVHSDACVLTYKLARQLFLATRSTALAVLSDSTVERFWRTLRDATTNGAVGDLGDLETRAAYAHFGRAAGVVLDYASGCLRNALGARARRVHGRWLRAFRARRGVDACPVCLEHVDANVADDELPDRDAAVLGCCGHAMHIVCAYRLAMARSRTEMVLDRHTRQSARTIFYGAPCPVCRQAHPYRYALEAHNE